MKLAVKPKLMKILVAAAGILGLALRTVLYTAGVDRKGLLISGHWSGIGVWLLTAGVTLILLLWCRQLTGVQAQSESFPAALSSAAGAALAGIALVLCPVLQAPSPTFAMIEPLLRYTAAVSLIYISYCRFRGKTPLFLLHCCVCLYLALRLICQYRVWSADPQIQNYAFYLGAHVALMLTAYQFAAFDAGFGNCRTLWGAGLAAIYLSIVSLTGSEEPFFLICCTLWIFSSLNLPSANPPKNQPTQEELP